MPLSPLSALSTKCATTALCYLRSVSLWGVVIVLFLFGIVRARATSIFERNNTQHPTTTRPKTPPPTDTKKKN
ncbi:hypothetical protein PG993_012480 [Apiospora rasikravindrae]|uniref:Uncharacterized protein n=1 Tax=Apiospora rasikravindrae TaxID=990691 RepID=A0ABR1S2J8_9PEZI